MRKFTAMLLCLALLSGCSAPAFVKDGAAAYFDTNPGRVHVFGGSGGETASFELEITGEALPDMEYRIRDAGSEKNVTLHLSHDEAAAEAGENTWILLREPVTTGTTWQQPDGGITIITAIEEPVKVPIGLFYAVQTTTLMSDGGTLVCSYTKNLGLIHFEYSRGEEPTVTGKLKQIKRADTQ